MKSGRPAPGRASKADRPEARGVRPPRFRAFLAVSLDGYIADASGGVGWLDAYHSPEIDFGGFMKTIGATVMGRATYDWTAAQGRPGGGGGKVTVLTHRPIEPAEAGVETCDGGVRGLAERLRRELAGTGKDVWLIGGGRCIAAFAACGLVDTYELAIVPVLLGDGVPLFPKRDGGLGALELQRSRTLSNGVIEAVYAPRR